MKHIDHAAKMAAQDPGFPDYDERGWPSPIVCAVDELRQHAARLREIAAALRSTNALRANSLDVIADSLGYAAEPAERYMTETAGPGLGTQGLSAGETVEGSASDVAVLEGRRNGDWEQLAHIGPSYADGPIGEYDLTPYRLCDLRIRWLQPAPTAPMRGAA